MRYLDSILQKQPYIATDYFSMADIAVIGGMIFAGYLDLAVPDDCKSLSSWYAGMKERSSVKAWFAEAEAALKAMSR